MAPAAPRSTGGRRSRGQAVDAADVPTLAIGGWNDLFPQGTVRNYLRAKDQTTLLMLPGAHGEFAPGVPQFQAGRNAMLSWFDRYPMQRKGVPKPGAKVTSGNCRGCPATGKSCRTTRRAASASPSVRWRRRTP